MTEVKPRGPQRQVNKCTQHVKKVKVACEWGWDTKLSQRRELAFISTLIKQQKEEIY